MRLLWTFSVALIGVTLADYKRSANILEILDLRIGMTGHNVDTGEPAPELAARNNYEVEIHRVKTEDDYILEMHRITGSPTCHPAHSESRPVVLIMHGIFSSSADWLVSGPGRSLAYLLSDAGYDVWLGNARGNTYSISHSRLTADEEQFWDFSFHEIGFYDLPAMIDYALGTTGQEQLVYIGHSQGTTTFYVMASTRPEYNEKIKVMFSLAPIAYMGRLYNPLVREIAGRLEPLKEFLERRGVHQFFASSHSAREAKARADLCSNLIVGKLFCRNIIFLIGGFDSPQIDLDLLPIIFRHYPAGSSVRQLIHYGQAILSHKFRQYDFGDVENRRRYGSMTPPNYNLRSITAPVHLFYSENDWLSSVQDVTQLYQELGNPVEMSRVPYATWEHFDYLYGKDARSLVYEPIIRKLANSYGLRPICF